MIAYPKDGEQNPEETNSKLPKGKKKKREVLLITDDEDNSEETSSKQLKTALEKDTNQECDERRKIVSKARSDFHHL